jgi:hypothetical protein
MRPFDARSVPRQLMVHRRTLVTTALAAALAAVVAGCSGSLRSVTQPDRLAVNRAAAWAAARAAIGHVPLPAGAVLVAHEPAGDHGLLAIDSGTDQEIAHDPDMAHVSLHAWWTVPRSAAQVLRYVGNHPTPGSAQTGSGDYRQLSTPRRASDWVNASWPLPGRGIASRRLQVTVTRLADGRTGVMASVDVEWVVPRPASEVVPSGARSVTLTLVRPRHGGGVGSATDVTLHTPRMIRDATRLVESLTAEQPIRLPCAEFPSTYKCPADPSGPGSLTVSFRTGHAGAALAEARVGIPVGWGYTGVIGDPIRFWVHGHPAHALSGAAFVRHMLALAGLHTG